MYDWKTLVINELVTLVSKFMDDELLKNDSSSFRKEQLQPISLKLLEPTNLFANVFVNYLSSI